MMDLEGILTSIELCYKAGEYIVEKCQNWRNATQEVDERINQIEAIWDKTRQQTDFLRRIDATLDDEYRRILDNSIGFLGEKLSAAVTSLNGVLGNEHGKRHGFHGFGVRVRKGKYAFLKNTLDEVIKDLEAWHRRFDPSWYLMMRIASPIIDQQLNEMTVNKKPQANGVANSLISGTAPPKAKHRQSPLGIAKEVRAVIHSPDPTTSIMRVYVPMDRTPIPYSTVSLASHRSTSRGMSTSFIIDSLHRYAGSRLDDLEKDVRNLAKRLMTSDPFTFGLLRCKCPMRAPAGASALSTFELVLEIPEGMANPTSLRQMLLKNDGQPPLSLTGRLQIAQELANSISYVHSFNFVHKGVCPESILLLEDTYAELGNVQKVFHTFLAGFGSFRAANADTVLIGDTVWEKNIYRHPERQGEFLQESYRMQHDVYSLGVCLLEIGLWESFIEYASDTEPQKPKDSKSYQNFRAWADTRMEPKGSGDKDLASQRTGSQVSHSHRTALLLREYLIYLAETRLPCSMGEIYRDVVVACLSSGEDELDKSEDELGREAAEDKDGISVGVHFIEEVLGKLAVITL